MTAPLQKKKNWGRTLCNKQLIMHCGGYYYYYIVGGSNQLILWGGSNQSILWGGRNQLTLWGRQKPVDIVWWAECSCCGHTIIILFFSHISWNPKWSWCNAKQNKMLCNILKREYLYMVVALPWQRIQDVHAQSLSRTVHHVGDTDPDMIEFCPCFYRCQSHSHKLCH